MIQLEIFLHMLSFLLQVATFILQKILLDETGLSYICQTYERFSHVAMILVSVIMMELHLETIESNDLAAQNCYL